MSDIVRELLSRASDEDGIGWTPTTVIPVPARLLHHAADRIEQLEAALREIAGMDEVALIEFKKGDGWLHQRVARAALEDRT